MNPNRDVGVQLGAEPRQSTSITGRFGLLHVPGLIKNLSREGSLR